MPQTYIYSPFTSQVRGLNTYCIDGTPHYSGFSGYGMCCPIDIGGTISAGTSVRFYSSASIGSIRTIRRSDFCVGNWGSPWEDAVFVELYRFANADCHIGTLFYGHLTNRIADGVYNSPNNGRVLGYLPTAHQTCCCYTYPHIHIGRDTNGITRSLSCYQVLTKQTSWFYSWFYNDGMC